MYIIWSYTFVIFWKYNISVRSSNLHNMTILAKGNKIILRWNITEKIRYDKVLLTAKKYFLNVKVKVVC